MHLFKWQRRVEFSETDMAGIVHFSNYYRYLEMAEHAMFRQLGYSIHDPAPDALRWPRVHTRCDYKLPLRFEDSFNVYIYVKKLSQKTVEYLMPIKKIEAEGERLVAVGRMIVACCRFNPEEGRMRAIPIPDILRDALHPADPTSYAAFE